MRSIIERLRGMCKAGRRWKKPQPVEVPQGFERVTKPDTVVRPEIKVVVSNPLAPEVPKGSSYRDRFDFIFREEVAAQRTPIHWTALKAQAMAESAMNPEAVSKVGAKGLMQFMPATWNEWAAGQDIFEPRANIRAGAKYMRWLLERGVISGNIEKAWAAYNWGIGNMTRCLEKHGDSWLTYAPKETFDYIERIKRFWKGA